MRVLTVGNMYPPHHLGGYELIWQSSVEQLRGAGHEVRVLTTTHREPGVKSDDDPDAYRELRWYWRDHGFPRLSLRERLKIERHNAATFDRHVSEFEPDAVGWWAMGGMSLSLVERARRQNLPAAGFVCDEWMSYGPRVDAWHRVVGRPILRSVAGAVTGIPSKLRLSDVGPWIFPSEVLRSGANDRWALADTTVVSQGVDHALFRPTPEKDWKWKLLYVGRIDSRKGIDLAVRALRDLPDSSELRVVGSGDSGHLEELHLLSRELGLANRVEFVPRISRQDLPGTYAAADVLLFPVLWEEPWGLVPLEAMAVGIPVIATGRGGSGEYLRDGENCLLFNPDRGPEALAAAIGRLARGGTTRERLREGGFETSRAISESDFDEAVEVALKRAVSLRGGSGRRRGER